MNVPRYGGPAARAGPSLRRGWFRSCLGGGDVRVGPQHHRFALADPVFYDLPSRRRSRRTRPLAPPPGLEWGAWRCVDDGTWSFRTPRRLTLPAQGWKIHVSATPATAPEVVRRASAYCHAHELAFKHLPDLGSVLTQIGKDANRSASGKVVTIYPDDSTDLHTTLSDLHAALEHLPGPWILSDLRWQHGPVSVRFGSFETAWLRDDAGRKRHGMRGPGGELVEDRREAAFTPPAWVELPPFLQEQWDRLGDGSAPEGFAYEVVRPLAYSNAGGTYLARDRDGADVVLKEARPRTGLTPDGRDAVTRVREEHARLVALSGPGVVAARELVEVQEHTFLVLEHVEGMPLNRAMVTRTPVIRAAADADDYHAYRGWALRIGAQIDAAVARIHDAGFTHGDLHPGNIIVTPDDRVVLLDFEFSTPAEAYAPVEMGAPGFVPPDGRGGIDADLYALTAVKLALFCPLTPLIPLDPAKLDELLVFARDAFALPEVWVQKVGGVLRPQPLVVRTPSKLAAGADAALRTWDVDSEAGVSELLVMIGRSLASAADPSRSDRLWPGDPAQFAEDATGLAHGAAGVIHAMHSCALDVDPLALAWFRDATDASLDKPDADLGFYDGLAGAAWVHRQRGDHARADAILARLQAMDTSAMGLDLYGGISGIGLLFLSESARQPDLLDDAVKLAKILQERRDARPLPESGAPVAVGERGAGLMWGAAGAALFALRLYERTGDARHLALAVSAVDEDLRHCATGDDGSLHVDEGRRLMPYLASGSTGIGVVLAQLLPHVDDTEPYRRALDGIIRAACTPFTIEGGMFEGRAGIIAFHVAMEHLGLATPETRTALFEHASALRLHAIRHATGIGFAGDGLLRQSCDLATGSAGALLALNAYSLLDHGSRPLAPSPLPFLLPPRSAFDDTVAEDRMCEGR